MHPLNQALKHSMTLQVSDIVVLKSGVRTFRVVSRMGLMRVCKIVGEDSKPDKAFHLKTLEHIDQSKLGDDIEVGDIVGHSRENRRMSISRISGDEAICCGHFYGVERIKLKDLELLYAKEAA